MVDPSASLALGRHFQPDNNASERDFLLQVQTSLECRNRVGYDLGQLLIHCNRDVLDTHVDEWNEIFIKMDEKLKFLECNQNAVHEAERECAKLEKMLKLEEQLLRDMENNESTDDILACQKDLLANIEKETNNKLERVSSSIDKRLSESRQLGELGRLLGGRIKSESDRSWIVEFTTTIQTPLGDEYVTSEDRETVMTLEVELTFEQVCLSKRITAVKTSIATLEIDDITAEAKKSQNVHWLLLCIYERWKKYCLMFVEVEQLRNRYALDWLHADGIIRVLYGGPTSATCTLKLNDKYPLCTSGAVSLQSASGLPAGITLETLQIPETISSLAESLEYLKCKLLPSISRDTL